MMLKQFYITTVLPKALRWKGVNFSWGQFGYL